MDPITMTAWYQSHPSPPPTWYQLPGVPHGHPDNDRPPRFQKMDFPKFDGKSNPLAFINRCESFFHQQRIAAEEQVWMASYNLEGGAQLWYMQVQRDEGTPPWRRFTELLNLHFGPPLRSNPLGDLMARPPQRGILPTPAPRLALSAPAPSTTRPSPPSSHPSPPPAAAPSAAAKPSHPTSPTPDAFTQFAESFGRFAEHVDQFVVMFHRWLANQEKSEKELQAAVRLQAAARGFLARRQVQSLCGEKQLAVASRATPWPSSQEQAAVRLQATVRGFLVRRVMRKMRMLLGSSLSCVFFQSASPIRPVAPIEVEVRVWRFSVQQHTPIANQIYALHCVGKFLGFNFRLQDKAGKAIRWAGVLLHYDIEDGAIKLSSSRASWVSKGGGDVMGSQQAATGPATMCG